MSILITGVAGFIGFHTANALLKKKYNVIGVDSLNNYYDLKLKKDRLEILLKNDLIFHQVDISDKKVFFDLVKMDRPKYIIHLAAQAGVRYSIDNPEEYVKSNLEGFFNILEASRYCKVKHLVYASSSSVYGGNKTFPFKEIDNVDNPVSFYAATKKSNEIMAHSYSHLYKIPSTGLRFFTVYGPWGRPDMALFLFTNKIISNQEINVFGHGKMQRDFTYIDDIVKGIEEIIFKPPNTYKDVGLNSIKSKFSEIYNIGNNKPTDLEYFISLIEKGLGKKAKKNYIGMQKGDVRKTAADISKLKEIIGFSPTTNIEDGVKKFLQWYKSYYK